MTAKRVNSEKSDSKLVFDPDALRIELLELHAALSKKQHRSLRAIQREIMKYIPAGISLADELSRDRKHSKS